MRLNLATKMTMFMGGAMVFVVMAMALPLTIFVEKSLLRAHHLRCLSSAENIARHLQGPLISNNLYSLHLYLSDTLNQGLFNRSILLDQNNKVLMHTDLKEVGKIYNDPISQQARETKIPLISNALATEDGPLEDEVIMPIIVAGTRLGTLRLGHSHEEIDNTISYVRKWIIYAGLGAFALSLALANILASYMTRPIRRLTQATRRVAKGELDRTVDIREGDELGELAQAFNTMTSELKRTTVSYDYLNNIFNSAGDAIRTINLDYAVERNNRSMAGLLNVRQKNIQGYKCHQLLLADICNTDECVLRRVLNGENMVQLETPIKLYDGREKHVSITATPLLENNRVVGVIESIQDISEHKKALEESRNLQNQLVQAQKMESVGRLAGGVAHDFNNLLSVIIGYSELSLLALPDGHPLTDKLQQIEYAARKAETLVRQLLAFSRKQVLEMTTLNLNDVITNMMKMLGRIIGEDIVMEINLADSTRNIYADQSQLVQVLMNLAVNARDAMPNGGKLFIETSDIDLDEEYARMYDYVRPGPYVLLSVSDTGIGMSDEVLKNIFEPFYTTKGVDAGTGLGLSTVYGTIKQHGGHIHVYSEPGTGSTFKIYMPVTEKENEEESVEETWEQRKGSESILVVDDEIIIRQLIISTLKPLGYKLYEAADAEKALELFKDTDERIDLLITDVIMPGMNGRDLAKHIAAMSPDTKIIFMSGYTQSLITQDDLGQKNISFFQKPVTPSILSEKLREALDCPREEA